ncbi:MAG TPA: hypothetical protein VG368_04880 [Acidimicrobiales bacterium]|nr:hypothetical protein [Acidimicrobiales bacterium]
MAAGLPEHLTVVRRGDWTDEPCLVCKHDEMHSIASLKLGQDESDVSLDRVLSEDDLFTISVLDIPRAMPEYVELSWGELRQTSSRLA